MNNIVLAFLFTLLAGLSTCLGSLLVFFKKANSKAFFAFCLSFSAGVMIYVSFVEILQKARTNLSSGTSSTVGMILTLVGFFGGLVFIAVIQKLLTHQKTTVAFENNTSDEKSKANLLRTGIFTALAMAIHNFPEGLVTFVSTLQGISVATPIVIAIAIHNIPEGIAVSIPILVATGSKKKAFFYSLLSGLTEPLGAIVGYLILMPFLNEVVFGVIFAAVSGIMVFISVDELIPAAREHGSPTLSIVGFTLGMATMALSLVLAQLG